MKKSKEEILKLFNDSAEIISKSKALVKEVQSSIEVIINCLKHDNKLILFGNGGSAADAQHMAAEFIGRYLVERKSIPAISLTTDSSILTAIGNDYGFAKIFSRQCESIVRKGDVIIAITTSGNSKNVIEGVKTAKKKGGIIIGLTGGDGGKLKSIADFVIVIPSKKTPRIQEGHRTIIHIICDMTERYFMKQNLGDSA